MKNKTRRIIAIIALTAIVVLVAVFAISAFTATPGESGNRFLALLFCMIAIPILAWLLLFCISRMQNKNTMVELFLEHENDDKEESMKEIKKN